MTDLPRPPSPTRRRFLLTLGAAGASAAVGKALWHFGRCGKAAAPPAGLRAVRRTGFALGADVSVVAMHENPVQAAKAVDAAFAEIETVESVMSLYRTESQVCRLNQDRELLRPHPYLVQVLRKAQSLTGILLCQENGRPFFFDCPQDIKNLLNHRRGEAQRRCIQ